MNVTKNTEIKVIDVSINLSVEEANQLKVFLGCLSQPDVKKLLETYKVDAEKVYTMTYNLYGKLLSAL